jgi:hypothetical protein
VPAVSLANDHRVTPLALACENRSLAVVDRLLKAGADANAAISPRNGNHDCVTHQPVGVVDALLARGAKVNVAEPSHNQTALMWAVSEQHPDVVHTLIAHGADVKARSLVRRRTVQTGDRYGDQNSIRQIRPQDFGGFTPILFAARVGDVASAEQLLRAGADVTIAGRTARPRWRRHAPAAAGRSPGCCSQGRRVDAAGAGWLASAPPCCAAMSIRRGTLAKAPRSTRRSRREPCRYYSKDYAFNKAGRRDAWLAARFGDGDIIRASARRVRTRSSRPDGTTALMSDYRDAASARFAATVGNGN